MSLILNFVVVGGVSPFLIPRSLFLLPPPHNLLPFQPFIHILFLTEFVRFFSSFPSPCLSFLLFFIIFFFLLSLVGFFYSVSFIQFMHFFIAFPPSLPPSLPLPRVRFGFSLPPSPSFIHLLFYLPSFLICLCHSPSFPFFPPISSFPFPVLYSR